MNEKFKKVVMYVVPAVFVLMAVGVIVDCLILGLSFNFVVVACEILLAATWFLIFKIELEGEDKKIIFTIAMFALYFILFIISVMFLSYKSSIYNVMYVLNVLIGVFSLALLILMLYSLVFKSSASGCERYGKKDKVLKILFLSILGTLILSLIASIIVFSFKYNPYSGSYELLEFKKMLESNLVNQFAHCKLVLIFLVVLSHFVNTKSKKLNIVFTSLIMFTFSITLVIEMLLCMLWFDSYVVAYVIVNLVLAFLLLVASVWYFIYRILVYKGQNKSVAVS